MADGKYNPENLKENKNALAGCYFLGLVKLITSKDYPIGFDTYEDIFKETLPYFEGNKLEVFPKIIEDANVLSKYGLKYRGKKINTDDKKNGLHTKINKIRTEIAKKETEEFDIRAARIRKNMKKIDELKPFLDMMDEAEKLANNMQNMQNDCIVEQAFQTYQEMNQRYEEITGKRFTPE